MPGAEIRLPAGGGSVTAAAQMDTMVPVEKLEIFWNGRPVETVPVASDARTLRIEKTIPVKESGWLTLRARGGPSHPVDDNYVVAETNPIYVYVGDKPIRSKADAEYFIRWIDGITKLAQEHPGWRSDQERKHVLSQFAEARKIFEERASEALIPRGGSMNRRDFLVSAAAVAAVSAASGAAPDFSKVRADFPRALNETYFNSGAQHPLGNHTVRGMQRYIEFLAKGPGEGREDFWETGFPQVKPMFASLINAKPSEIALCGSTTIGENIVWNGMELRGGNVVTNDLHYTASLANYCSGVIWAST